MLEILLACTLSVDIRTLDALIQTESSYNPYAIALVNEKPLKKQPSSYEEAVEVINNLEKRNANYSVGLGQINKVNFERFQVTGKELLDPCLNLEVAEKILLECQNSSPNNKISEALSCYYSGNHSYGFKKEKNGTAYLERIVMNHDLRRAIGKERDFIKQKIAVRNKNQGETKTQKKISVSNSPIKINRGLSNKAPTGAHIFK